MDLFRRYAEVALESSERRHAVIELSTIVEATKRLNSTLDLAELSQHYFATHHAAHRRGARDGVSWWITNETKSGRWSGLGLDQHEIRLPIR